MPEDQVDVEVLVADGDAPLAATEVEAGAEFEQEFLDYEGSMPPRQPANALTGLENPADSPSIDRLQRPSLWLPPTPALQSLFVTATLPR